MAHHISIDIMEQFSITKRQKQFLLIIVDYFARLVELFPLRTTMADVIVNIEENNESIDIHKEFNSNVTWGKLPYVSGSVDALI
ncbi:unnamed protein product [Rotaria magnacalcarata]|uniref:Uncharacterized protein n=2 Tax=Rotaria magnacalcarata TaxID=392030 RepID=A0A8S2N4N3_9BILA|nr:unnamed protein product [Rotaria magnacalcarata]